MADHQKHTESEASLDERLATLRDRHGRGDGSSKARKPSENQGWGKAIKMSSEFISAVIVGAMIGYVLDRFAGTAPWGMIFFLMLGFVAGVVNILRATGQVANPYDTGWASKKARDGDDPPAR